MAELVDAHDSGSCVRKDVEVRVLSWAHGSVDPVDTEEGLSERSEGLFSFLAALLRRQSSKPCVQPQRV